MSEVTVNVVWSKFMVRQSPIGNTQANTFYGKKFMCRVKVLQMYVKDHGGQGHVLNICGAIWKVLS